MRWGLYFHLALAPLLALTVTGDVVKQVGDALVARLPIEGKNCFNVSVQTRTGSSRYHDVCLPQIVVGGVRKCGTSALFQLLATHQSTLPTVKKELCLQDQNYLNYFRRLPHVAQASNKTIVSGCIWEEDVVRLYRALDVSDLKVLLIVRDFPEQAWAAYNFWCEPHLDQNCGKQWDWTTNKHYRSPEMFHEIVRAQQLQPDLKLWMHRLVSGASTFYQNVVTTYTNVFGENNVFVISQQDLETDAHKVWHKIAAYTGLDPHHERMEEWSARRYNTQDGKGETKFKSISAYTPSVYPVSGNRPMLNETRAILNELWKEDCLWLKSKYNLEFSACASPS